MLCGFVVAVLVLISVYLGLGLDVCWFGLDRLRGLLI